MFLLVSYVSKLHRTNKMSSSKLIKYEENNWACVVVCLKTVAGVLPATVEKRFRTEIESWGKATKDQFTAFTRGLIDGSVCVSYVTFAERKERKKRKITNVWEITKGDQSFENVMRKVLDIHSNPRSNNIQWDSNGCRNSEIFWILAKMFMPYGNRDNCDPKEADPISYFDLLRNCKLFKDFDIGVIDQICSARNEVMHSIDQRLTSDEKDHYISMMQKFLDTPCIQGVAVSEAKRNMERMKRPTVFFESADIEKVERDFKKMYPNRIFNRQEFLEDTGRLYESYVSSGIKHLKEELEKDKKALNEQEAEVVKYKRIGGITGAAVGGTTGLATAAAVAGAVGATVGAPVIIAGGIVAGLGYVGGRAGGAVIGLFRRITGD